MPVAGVGARQRAQRLDSPLGCGYPGVGSLRMTQITRYQHYVPAFYFKRFAKEEQIQVFDVRAKRIEKPRHYGSMCHKEFFYAAETGVQDELSQALEALFSAMEDVIAKALPGIIERTDAQKLTNGDLDMLAYFMSFQWLRTPLFRERLQKMQSEIRKWMLEQRAAHSPRFLQDHIQEASEAHEVSEEKLREAVNRLIESGEYDFRETNNASHLNFIGEEEINGFCNLLLAKKWRIILSEGPYHFITSDNPVVEWIPPRTGIFGSTFMDRRHLLALTPDILIETCRPDSMNPKQQPGDRLSYHTDNGKEVLVFNKEIAKHAHQFAYAPQTEEFEQLLKAT